MLSPDLIARLSPGAEIYAAAFARGLEPDPDLSVAQWTADRRVVSSESSSRPGKWLHENAPHLVEPMEELSPSSPVVDVTVVASSQVGKTELGVNFLGYVADVSPGPMGIYFPTTQSAQLNVKSKIQPAIDASPALRAKIREEKSRSADGSTTLVKRFPGGYAMLFGVNSSVALQSWSLKFVWKDEVTEYPFEVGDRGDPIGQINKRTETFDEHGAKRLATSTTGVKGSCRITAEYLKSDMRRRYLPCPHCGHFQVLKFDALRYEPQAPHHAHFICRANGCIIEHHEKRDMALQGHWIKCYPGDDAPPDHFDPRELAGYLSRPRGGREAGFHFWQAISLFSSWDKIAAEYVAAKDDAKKLRVFFQQVLAEPYELKVDVPDAEALLQRREQWPSAVVPVASGALFLTGFCDVQKNRLEWAVWAWSAGLTGWRIDKGVIEGRPEEDPRVWQQLARVVDRDWRTDGGKKIRIDAFGVDAGYLSGFVYRFVRRYQGTGRVFALDGRAGWGLPPIGTPSTRDVDYQGRKIGEVQLWPTGTFDLKAEHYGALGKTLRGPDAAGQWRPGALRFNTTADQTEFEQLTSEYLKEVTRPDGITIRTWAVMPGRRNEQLDIAVGARALAHHLSDNLTLDDWRRLTESRQGQAAQTQRELFDVLFEPAADDAPADDMTPPPEQGASQAAAEPLWAVSAPETVQPAPDGGFWDHRVDDYWG
jgi:phage terminase large subunit GpA-like protein